MGELVSWHKNPTIKDSQKFISTILGISFISIILALGLGLSIEEKELKSFKAGNELQKRVVSRTYALLDLNIKYLRVSADEKNALLNQMKSVVKQRKKEMVELMISSPAAALEISLPPQTYDSIPHELKDSVEKQVMVDGSLQITHYDYFRDKLSKQEYFLRTINNKRLQMYFPDEKPIGLTGIKLQVKGVELDGKLAVKEIDGEASLDNPVLAASTVKNVAVILANFQDDRREQISKEKAREIIFTRSDSTNAYYKEASFNLLRLEGKDRIDGDVFGWYTLPFNSKGGDSDPNNDSPCEVLGSWAESAKLMAEKDGFDISGYTNFIIIYPPVCGVIQGGGGSAELGGSTSAMWGLYNAQSGVIDEKDFRYGVTHELGHNFGVLHASALDCTNLGQRTTYSGSCQRKEYDDPFDVMGGLPNFNIYHLNNYHKKRIGLLDRNNIKLVSTNGIYKIKPIETASPDIQILQLNAADQEKLYTYQIEYRKPFGFDNFSITSPIVTGVSIRRTYYDAFDVGIDNSELLDTTPETPTYQDAALQKGKTIKVDNIRITLLDYNTTEATVDVNFESEYWYNKELLVRELVASCSNTGEIKMEAVRGANSDIQGFYIDEVTPTGRVRKCEYKGTDDGNHHTIWTGQACGTSKYANASGGFTYQLGQSAENQTNYFSSTEVLRGRYVLTLRLYNLSRIGSTSSNWEDGKACRYVIDCNNKTGGIPQKVAVEGKKDCQAGPYGADWYVKDVQYTCQDNDVKLTYKVYPGSNKYRYTVRSDVTFWHPWEEVVNNTAQKDDRETYPICDIKGFPPVSTYYDTKWRREADGDDGTESVVKGGNVCYLKPTYQPSNTSFTFADCQRYTTGVDAGKCIPDSTPTEFTFFGETNITTFKGDPGKIYRVGSWSSNPSGAGGDDDDSIEIECPKVPITGKLTASSSSCNISTGQTSCPLTLSWTTSNASNATVKSRSDGQVLATNTAGSTTVQIPVGQKSFDLFSGTNRLSGVTVTGVATQTKFLLAGKIYSDNNNNGIIDVGDPTFFQMPLTVTLSNGQTTVSNTYDGSYVLRDIPAGVYSVSIPVPPGFSNVIYNNQIVNLNADKTDVNFLIQSPTVRGHVYIDYGDNGQKDCQAGFPCDVGYEGGWVDLYHVVGTQQYYYTSVYSDLNGNYVFTGLGAAGDLNEYALRFWAPNGYRLSSASSPWVLLAGGRRVVDVGLVPLPPEPPDNYEPKGSFDSANCQEFAGWTCDLDQPNNANDVYFYADYWQDWGTDWHKTYVGTIKASLQREQAVANLCGGNPYHGFRFPVPAFLKDNSTHQIYARGGNLPNEVYNDFGAGVPLGITPTTGDPKPITCSPAPSPTPTLIPSSTPTPTPRPTNTPIPTSSATPTISSADNTPPLITITSPNNGATFTNQGSTTINAKATDASGVANIKISIDGIVKKTCIPTYSGQVCSYYWPLTSEPKKTFTITATAQDKATPVPNTGTKNITVKKQ